MVIRGKLASRVGFLILASIACVSLASPAEIAAQPEFHWPMKILSGLSATFGEYRASHLHAGIDIRTSGQTGLPVRAAADGEIYRLSCSYRGYGKAIYIRHSDGFVSVYGHLERFEEDVLHLESLLWEERRNGGFFPGTMYTSRPVTRGQIIGYSGESGSGLPHLHFELRHGEEQPVNPFEHGLTYADTQKPAIRTLYVVPISENSRINGYPAPVRIDLQKPGKHSARESPLLSGTVAMMIDCYDQAGAVNKVGIYQLDVKIDDRHMSRITASEVTYGTNSHRVGLLYDVRYSSLSPTRYVYRLGESLSYLQSFFHIPEPNRIPLDANSLSAGNHMLSIVASDAAGNHEDLKFPFRVEQQSEHERNEPGKVHESTVPDNYMISSVSTEMHDTWMVIKGTVKPDSATSPLVEIATEKNQQWTRLREIERQSGNFAAVLPLNGNLEGKLLIRVCHPVRQAEELARIERLLTFVVARMGGTIHRDDFSVSIPPSALYSDTFLSLEQGESNVRKPLQSLTKTYTIEPVDLLCDKSIEVSFSVPTSLQAEISSLCIATGSSSNGRWHCLESSLQGDGILTTNIRTSGQFTLIRDTSAPIFRSPSPEMLRKANHGGILNISLEDRGKGIDEKSLEALIDTESAWAEFDPDHGRVMLFLPAGLNSGRHSVRLSVKDFAGNAARPLEFELHLTGDTLTKDALLDKDRPEWNNN